MLPPADLLDIIRQFLTVRLIRCSALDPLDPSQVLESLLLGC
jgi:hypothetical protein